jgi:hypothetical protein
MGAFKNGVKNAAAATFGVMGGAAVVLLGALAFLVPGVVIIMLQLKKTEEKRSTGLMIAGFALAFVGVALGLGMGLGAVMELLQEALGE